MITERTKTRSLGELSKLTGRSVTSLRHAVQRGQLAARMSGHVWLTTINDFCDYVYRSGKRDVILNSVDAGFRREYMIC